jgi:hypothetical protein
LRWAYPVRIRDAYLDTPDAQRAQKVRVAVIHEDRRRAEVMQTLQDLLPDDKP